MTRTLSSDDVTKTERPHWVKAMDKRLTHTSYPEYWNRNIKGDLSEENWKTMKTSNSSHTKKDSKRIDGSRNSFSDSSSIGSTAMGHHRTHKERTGSWHRSRHSDTASLTSRVTSSTERRRRQNSRRLIVFLIFLVLALILAVLFGWLLYYLLMKDDPRRDRVLEEDRRALNADLSMRVLNLRYNQQLADNSSKEFQNVANSLCQKMDVYFLTSNLSEAYHGCHVQQIRNVVDVRGCQCYSTSSGNLLIDFHLTFNWTESKRENLRWTIFDVIESGSDKHHIGGLVFVYVDNFLVDIRTNWHKSYDGIMANVTMPVYNLNYTYMLADPNSLDFRSLADPFCEEVSMILATTAISPFRNRFQSCLVSNFKTRPNRITFFVHLTGGEWRSVQKNLIFVLLMGARNGTVMQQPVKMIGSLAVTPWTYNIDYILHPINISSITTPAPTTPSPTTPMSTPSITTEAKLLYVYSIYQTYNLTLTPDLRDQTSEYFKQLTREFCDDLARLYDLSVYGYRFYKCQIPSFRSDPTSIVVRIGYLGDPWPEMDNSVTWVIRQHAPKYYFDLKEVYLVGSIYLIMGHITANGLELRTSLQVLNLTFTPDLADQRSPLFRYHSQRFCQDMTTFYYQSYLKDRFLDCGVDQFTNDPVQIHFYLVFMGTSMDGLPDSIVQLIRRYAPPFYYLIYLAYLVGDLLVLPEDISTQPSVYPTNITLMSSTMASTFTSTSTEIISSSSSSLTDDDAPRGIKLILYYEVYNLTFTNDLKDPNSQRFLRHKYAVCDDLWRWFMDRNSPFLNIYRECDVTSFTSNPNGVTFTLLFETKFHETFTRAVRTHLEYYAPKVYVPGFNLLDVGHLLLIMDRYIIDITTTIVPSPTLMPPSMTTSSIVTTSFTMMSTPVTMTSTSTASADVTSSSMGVMVVLSYEAGLADFVFTPDLMDRTSARFQFLQRRFCKDIDGYYINSSLRNVYVSCRIDGFRQSSRQGYPEKIYFSLTFDTPMFYEMQQLVVGILLREPPRVPRSGYLTLHVGDLFLIIDTFTTVIPESITSKKDYTPLVTITTTDSASLAPTPTLTMTSTSLQTATTSTATSTSSMVTSSTMTTSTTQSSVTPSLSPSPTTPSTPPVSTEPTYFIRMSFETLNLTREYWLSDPNSPEFIAIEQLFCADLNYILNAHERFYPKFINCKIDSFGGDPLRVNFSLQFRDLRGKSRTEVKDLVVSMLVENAVRKEFNNVYSLLVGNLLIKISSLSVNFTPLPPTSNLYNAIGYNYSFFIYPGNFSVQLLDRRSQLFNVTAYKFCQDVDDLFTNVGLRTLRSRYYGCAVSEFGLNREIRFSIALSDTDIVRPSTMFNIFAYSGDQVYLDGIFYLKLGDFYFSVDVDPSYYLLTLETFFTHAYPYTTTEAPSVNTIITITLDVLQPSWSIELNDVTSARYRLLAESFCSDVSAWISEWNTDFIRCGNVRFSQNPFQITTELIFRGRQQSTLENDLNTIILERADWLPVDNMYAMAIGNMLIYDKSLVLTQRTVSVGDLVTTAETDATAATSPTPMAIVTSSNPLSITSGQPCAGASNLDYMPHPTQCDRFYQCVGGQAYPITCRDGFVFQGATCVEEPPGFVCQR